MRNNLTENFFAYAEKCPDAPALWVDGGLVSYEALAKAARGVAGWLRGHGLSTGSSRIALVVADTFEAYAALLGSAMAGVTYVPISPWFPKDYALKLMKRVVPDAVLLDRNGARALREATFSCPKLVLPEKLKSPSDHANALDHPVALDSSSLVHIMFTSGSTGEPKMVGQTLANIDAYLSASQKMYGFCATDRVSHFNELGWDPYLLDLYGAWDVGATTYAVPKRERLAPWRFIYEHRLTTWYSVPSVVMLVDRLGVLRPALYPDLRLTLFVGEPLTPEIVGKWQMAAPNSMVENVYGPTECTVVCAGFHVNDDAETTPERGYYPIGTAYDGSWMKILGPENDVLPAGSIGELVIGGKQVAPGYLDDIEKTEESFVNLGGDCQENLLWYRTGDLAVCDQRGLFHFMGRVDNQVKVLGNRVELEAVEAVLRDVSCTGEVAVIAGPVVDGIVQHLIAVVTTAAPSSEEIKKRAAQVLPTHMMPKVIRRLDVMPRNANGKIDRSSIKAQFVDRAVS